MTPEHSAVFYALCERFFRKFPEESVHLGISRNYKSEVMFELNFGAEGYGDWWFSRCAARLDTLFDDFDLWLKERSL